MSSSKGLQYTNRANMDLAHRLLWSLSICLVFFISCITVAAFMMDSGISFWDYIACNPTVG